MASLEAFLEHRLRLRVNREKSALARPWERTFLGYTVTWHQAPLLRVAPASVARLRDKIRAELRRGRGRSLRNTLTALQPLLRGWLQYFRLAEVRACFEEANQWLRRRLRCVPWRHWKRPRTRARQLRARGLDAEQAWRSAYNGRGPWWNAGASQMNGTVPTLCLTQLGLVSLVQEHRRLAR